MNTRWLATVMCALLLARCAPPAPRHLWLPTPDQPIETRVVAYRQYAAMPHAGMSGWQMRVGDGPVMSVSDARAVLANAPSAEEIFRERDTMRRVGWSLYGVGLAAMVASLALVFSALDDDIAGTTTGEGRLRASFVVLGLGAAVALGGGITAGLGELRISPAAEAYNRWLWQRLGLPSAQGVPGQ